MDKNKIEYTVLKSIWRQKDTHGLSSAKTFPTCNSVNKRMYVIIYSIEALAAC